LTADRIGDASPSPRSPAETRKADAEAERVLIEEGC
jgi:hypothetical protein